MSYVMPFYLGFFEHTAAALGVVQLRKPLDMAQAEQLLAEAGDRHENGFVFIGVDRFALGDDYVKCWDRPHRKGADFITRFARQTGCDIYNLAAQVVQSADAFAEFFEQAEKMRADRRSQLRALGGKQRSGWTPQSKR